MSRWCTCRRKTSWPGAPAGLATWWAPSSRRVEDFRRVGYRGPQLLLMGSEGPGLSGELAGAATRLVKIPMAGKLNSLNLAVATALMLYEMRKDRLRV